MANESGRWWTLKLPGRAARCGLAHPWGTVELLGPVMRHGLNDVSLGHCVAVRTVQRRIVRVSRASVLGSPQPGRGRAGQPNKGGQEKGELIPVRSAFTALERAPIGDGVRRAGRASTGARTGGADVSMASWRGPLRPDHRATSAYLAIDAATIGTAN